MADATAPGNDCTTGPLRINELDHEEAGQVLADVLHQAPLFGMPWDILELLEGDPRTRRVVAETLAEYAPVVAGRIASGKHDAMPEGAS